MSKGGKDWKVYMPLSIVETTLPIVFAVIDLCLFAWFLRIM
ncbi:MAG: hypothetical protein ACJAWF_003817 [Candidatus Azotimanducaceae bacterium]|jgi:hypothetical protein